MVSVLRDVQHAFFGLCVHAGKQALAEMIEADRQALFGPKGRPDIQRSAYRGGHTLLYRRVLASIMPEEIARRALMRTRTKLQKRCFTKVYRPQWMPSQRLCWLTLSANHAARPRRTASELQRQCCITSSTTQA